MSELQNQMNAYTLAINYGLMPRIEGKFEPFDLDYPERVFRLANRPTSDNIMVKFDSTQIAPPE